MIAGILSESLEITGFVFVMMLVVEYVNVLSRGSWQEALSRAPWRQYGLAVILGITPGCLGAFTVVALYAHGRMSFGALVAAMIATSGDEAFVMFSLFPQKAIILTAVLAAVGLVCGKMADALPGRNWKTATPSCDQLGLHETEDCFCFSWISIVRQWSDPSLARAALTLMLLTIVFGVTQGSIAGTDWNWVRITMLIGIAIALFVVVTAPEHFLNTHLWQHVARRHVLSVFLWTFGALLVTQLLTSQYSVETVTTRGQLLILVIGCLVGLIPESGPNLVFVSLFAKGAVPMSILLANSIVQDGHGMLPLLAHSRRTFVAVKGINFVAGLIIGLVVLLLGG